MKQILAVAVAGLFSIGAFAQASTPLDAPSQAPVAKHHHKKKHHKHVHHHQAASVSGDAAPVNP